jgi:hypothetical protein
MSIIYCFERRRKDTVFKEYFPETVKGKNSDVSDKKYRTRFIAEEM